MACTGEKRDVERILAGKSQGKKEGKKPLRTPRYTWEINKNNFLVGQKDVDWIDLAHNMGKWLVLVNNSNEPSYFKACRDFVTSSRTISFSRTPIYTVSFLLLTIKPTRCTNYSNLFLDLNSTCFGQFLLSIIVSFSLYTQQWYMSYRFADSL